MTLNSTRSFSLIANVDKSILLLNPYCKKYGFDIKFFNLTQIEKEFGSLFNLDNKERHLGLYINIRNNNHISVSHEFRGSIRNHIVFSLLDYHDEGGFYFLVKERLRLKGQGEELEDFYHFNKHFISRLRLLKHGGVSIPFWFVKSDNDYTIKEAGYNLSGMYLGEKKYLIQRNEIENAVELLDMKFGNKNINMIASQFFENCFHTNDYDAKFINCFIAFESIFNRSKDQLRHIISRHTAILISVCKEEFEEVYSNMKKLYDIRSSIVHKGVISNKDINKFGTLGEAVEVLMNYLRRVLVKCYHFTGTKDQLFDELNLKGVEKI